VLVALLDPREEHHEWATEALLTASQPWLTCEAVFSEALFLLQVPHARALLKLVRCGQLQIAFNLADQVEEVLDLLDKYNDTPMSAGHHDGCRFSRLPTSWPAIYPVLDALVGRTYPKIWRDGVAVEVTKAR